MNNITRRQALSTIGGLAAAAFVPLPVLAAEEAACGCDYARLPDGMTLTISAINADGELVEKHFEYDCESGALVSVLAI